jgi:hypothetical protein
LVATAASAPQGCYACATARRKTATDFLATRRKRDGRIHPTLSRFPVKASHLFNPMRAKPKARRASQDPPVRQQTFVIRLQPWPETTESFFHSHVD